MSDGWGEGAIGLKFNKTAIRAAAHKFPRRSYNLLLNYSFSRDRGRGPLLLLPSFCLDWYARLDAKINDFSGTDICGQRPTAGRFSFASAPSHDPPPLENPSND